MTQRLTPTLVSGGHTWASIETGFFHTVGITPSGAAYAWGANSYGELGDGTTSNAVSTPTLVSGGHTWASISTGDYHTVGLTPSGAAYVT
jgi:alpha-tubulin suppressor-like RCC1 family protein